MESSLGELDILETQLFADLANLVCFRNKFPAYVPRPPSSGSLCASHTAGTSHSGLCTPGTVTSGTFASEEDQLLCLLQKLCMLRLHP